MKSSKTLRFLDEHFVWVAVVLSVAAHFGTLWIMTRDTVVVPHAEVKKIVAKVRIFSNPNGNPAAVAKAVEVAKPKPDVKPKPKPDHKVINTKPVEKEAPQETPQENAGPQSFGDDKTGGVVGEGFSTTDGQGDAGVTSNAEPIEKIPPTFPQEARVKGVEGYVLLKFDISEEGKAENIEVIKAEPRNLFEKEAKNAVRKWRYTPRLVSGVPTKILGKEVRIDFKLSGE
ncbi:MAG: TonB family protein [Chitinophagaceae bacterium]|nr:TonB family protein [Oligoflexus sp.]